MENVLETKALTKKYKKHSALCDLDMHVPKGAIYGLIGENGAGKTTLIRLICGLQSPDSGQYYLYGKESREKEIYESRRRMGAVVETPSLYLDMTAYDNLVQQSMLLGRPSCDGMEALLELVGLAGTGKKKAKDFSLGMRQRLGIAIALAGNPDFLVLDEPVNGLDPEGIIEIRELILKLNRERRITVLISSHILDELSKLATHYGFIHQGKMVKEASAEELEQMFRKKTIVKTDNTKKLAKVLESLQLEYKILSDTEAEIYERITASELAAVMEKEGACLESVYEKDESLESYYIRLIGGERHE